MLPLRLRWWRDGVGTLVRSLPFTTAERSVRLLARGIFDLNPPVRREFEAAIAGALRAGVLDAPAAADQPKRRTVSTSAAGVHPPFNDSRFPAGSIGGSGRAADGVDDGTGILDAASQLAQAAFENVGAFWVEVLQASRLLRPSNWQQRASLTGQWGAVGAGPAILVTGYLGNPVVAACVLSCVCGPIHVLLDQVSGDIVRIEGRLASLFPGLRPIDASRDASRLPDVLAAGGRVLVIAGQEPPPGRGAVVCEFLGRRRRHYATLARLARRTTSPLIVFACTRRPGRFAFDLRLLDRVEPAGTAGEMTGRILRAIEEAVRRNPEQFLWSRA